MPKKAWVVHCTAGEFSDTTFSIVASATSREGALDIAREAAAAAVTRRGGTATWVPRSDEWVVQSSPHDSMTERYAVAETDLWDVLLEAAS